MADPTDIFCLDELQKVLRAPIRPAVVRESELMDILDTAYSRASEIASLAEQLDEELGTDAVDLTGLLQAAEDLDAPWLNYCRKYLRRPLASVHLIFILSRMNRCCVFASALMAC